jgi:hypothetical protein
MAGLLLFQREQRGVKGGMVWSLLFLEGILRWRGTMVELS